MKPFLIHWKRLQSSLEGRSRLRLYIVLQALSKVSLQSFVEYFCSIRFRELDRPKLDQEVPCCEPQVNSFHLRQIKSLRQVDLNLHSALQVIILQNTILYTKKARRDSSLQRENILIQIHSEKPEGLVYCLEESENQDHDILISFSLSN